MISGFYLGEIVRLVILDIISTGELFEGCTSNVLQIQNSIDTAHLSRIERDHSLELSDTKTVLEDLFEVPFTSFDDRRTVKRVCEVRNVDFIS